MNIVGELVELRSKIDDHVLAFREARGVCGGTLPQGTLAVVLTNCVVLEETEMALVVANGRIVWVIQDDTGPA